MGGLALLILALTAAPAAARKPDLVVKSAKMGDPEGTYIFKGSDEQVSFKANTKNVGNATARRSKTRLLFAQKQTSETGLLGPKLSVPKLKPGDSDTGRTSAGGFLETLPYDQYFVIACADSGDDVSEKDEGNNCHYTGRTLDVIARKFSGPVKGDAGPEFWGGDLEFTFWPAKSAEIGGYVYQPHGTLTYTVDYDQGGCSYKGTGTKKIDGTGYLGPLEYSQGTYTGSGVPFDYPFFWVTVSCPGNPSYKLHMNAQYSWLGVGVQPLFFDVKPFKVVDSYSYNGVHWLWNLTPEG